MNTDEKVLLEALKFGLDYDAGDPEGDEDEVENYNIHLAYVLAVDEAMRTGVLSATVFEALSDCMSYQPDWLYEDKKVYRAAYRCMARAGRLDKVNPNTVYWPSRPATVTVDGQKYLAP